MRHWTATNPLQNEYSSTTSELKNFNRTTPQLTSDPEFLTEHVDNILEHFVKEVNEDVAKEEMADG